MPRVFARVVTVAAITLTCATAVGYERDAGCPSLSESDAGRLRRAAFVGDAQLVASQIHQGVKVDATDEFGRTPLSYATEGGHLGIMQMLLAKGANPSAADKVTGATPLMTAAASGGFARVQMLIDQGADINARDDAGATSLSLATRQQLEQVARVLVEHGADDRSRGTALRLAIGGGSEEFVRFLLNHGADPNGDGEPILITALRAHRAALVTDLLAAGANAEATDDRGRTALVEAAAAGDAGTLRVLLQHGITPRSKQAGRALAAAAGAGHAEVVQALLDGGVSGNEARDNGHAALTLAAARGDLPIVRMLLRAGASPETPGTLAASIGAGHTDVVRALLDAGADPNAPGPYGFPPILALHGSGAAAAEMESILTAHGARPPDPAVMQDLMLRGRSRTLLDSATQGDEARVAELLASGRDPDEVLDGGSTPLLAAARAGHTEIVRQLLRAGANPSAVDLSGATALRLAVKERHADTVRVLLTAPASPRMLTAALHDAIAQREYDIVTLLLERGADPNGLDGGQTALTHAVEAGDQKVVVMLLDHGALIDAKSSVNSGETALLVAVERGDQAMVKFLIDRGAGVDVRDHLASTPLMAAAKRGSLETVELLLARGADLNTCDKYGQTPLMHARASHHAPIADALSRAGAREPSAALVLALGGQPPLVKQPAPFAPQLALDNAVRSGDIAAASTALEQGADLSAGVDGRPRVLAACQNQQKQMMEFLLQHGADLNARGRSQTTGVMLATLDRDTRSLDCLLGYGADVNAETPAGETALDLATKRKLLDMEATLRSHGGQPGSSARYAMQRPPFAPRWVPTAPPLPTAASSLEFQVEHETGAAPFQTTFRYEFRSPRKVQSAVLDVNGDGRELVTIPASDSTVQHTYARPGFYRPHLRITDTQGMTFDASAAVQVLDGAAIDAQISQVWDGMNQALIAGDKTKALTYLTPGAQEKYARVFDALMPQIREVVASSSPLQRSWIGSDIAEYAVNRTIDGRNHIFLIEFMKGVDGVWLIESM